VSYIIIYNTQSEGGGDAGRMADDMGLGGVAIRIHAHAHRASCVVRCAYCALYIAGGQQTAVYMISATS